MLYCRTFWSRFSAILKDLNVAYLDLNLVCKMVIQTISAISGRLLHQLFLFFLQFFDGSVDFL